MTFTMPDVAATRRKMLTSYLAGLRELVGDSTYTVRELRDGAEEAGTAADDALLGLRVVLRKDVDEALNAIFGQPVPMPDATWAEVHTPATIIVSVICPSCGMAQPISATIHPELLIDDSGRELRIKTKAKGRTHICGQLPLPVDDDAQQTLPLDGDQDGDEGPADEPLMLGSGEVTEAEVRELADDEPAPDANDVDFGEGAPNADDGEDVDDEPSEDDVADMEGMAEPHPEDKGNGADEDEDDLLPGEEVVITSMVPSVGETVVFDGEPLRIKSISPSGELHAKAAFGKVSASLRVDELAWDDDQGVWRVREG